MLVHGVLGQELFYWNFMRRRLRASGLHVAEVTLPSLALGDLREAAVSFRTKLHALLETEGAHEVDIVAHSAGGLAVRYYLKALTEVPHVRRLVTLGTPHSGTRTASLLPEVGMIGQVRPESPFLMELNNGDPTPAPTFYTAVWTPYDGVILPADSARLPAASNVENLLYPGVTHWGYLFGPRVARVIARELREGFVGGDRSVERAAPLVS